MKKTDMERNSRPRYIDPTVDFAFKRIFGTETNKDLLMAFLNELFRGRKNIKNLTYNKNEHVGDTKENGGVIFDLTCTASNGEQFIIEVQRAFQDNLKPRMLYYGSKLIADQAPKGKRSEWNYAISEVYVIVLMDGFTMPKLDSSTLPEQETTTQYLYDICLTDRDTGKLFYAEYGFIYIELLNFTKQETELQTDLDGWLFVLKNMSELNKIPLYLRKPIFEKLFNIAEYTNLNKEEKDMYDTDLKRKWDQQSIAETARRKEETARREGTEKGRKEGKKEGEKEGRKEGAEEKGYKIISNMIEREFDDATIALMTEESIKRVREIRAELENKNSSRG